MSHLGPDLDYFGLWRRTSQLNETWEINATDAFLRFQQRGCFRYARLVPVAGRDDVWVVDGLDGDATDPLVMCQNPGDVSAALDAAYGHRTKLIDARAYVKTIEYRVLSAVRAGASVQGLAIDLIDADTKLAALEGR